MRAFSSQVPPVDSGEEECSEDDGSAAAGDVMRSRAGKSAFWIDRDGKMLPCGQMADPAVNVLELGFAEAWKQTRANAAQIRLLPECAVCDIKNVCRACAAMCYCETGRFDGKPDYVCRMHRSYFSAMKQYCREAYGEEII